MPQYSYFCSHCDDIEMLFPMEPGPPPTVACPLCGRTATRVYKSVPVQYHAPGFTRALADRPDERIDAEIRVSQDVDPVTGVSWQEQDRRLAARKKLYGRAMEKQFVLPTKGRAEGDPMQEEANRVNRAAEEMRG